MTVGGTTVRLKWRYNLLLGVAFVTLVVLYQLLELEFDDDDAGPFGGESGSRRNPEMELVQLVTVSCGKPNYQGIRDIRKPLDQSLTMIKSAALFTRRKLHVNIFTENDMAPLFRGEIDSWPTSIKSKVSYTIRDADYKDIPPELKEQWKGWYKPCGSFRLLTPKILPEAGIHAAIYSDSDVVWTSPIEELWDILDDFDDKEVMAVSPTAGHVLGGSRMNENMILHNTGLFQINTGVMLMNFTRINTADWLLAYNEQVRERPAAPVKWGGDLLIPYYRRYKDKAEHDQKLMNIIFHFNPHLLKQLPCKWNWKTNFCQDDSNVCKIAEEEGPGAVHGITSAFFGTGPNSHPTFKALYDTFHGYEWDRNLEDSILGVFEDAVDRTAKHTYCGKKSHVISKSLRRSMQDIKL